MPIAFRKRRYPIATPHQALVKLEDGIWRHVYGYGQYSPSLRKNIFLFEDKSSIVGVIDPDFAVLPNSIKEDEAYDIACKYNISNLTDNWEKKEYARRLEEQPQTLQEMINQTIRERYQRQMEEAYYDRIR